MTFPSRKMTAFAALVVSFAAHAAGTNMVVNGSFEAPAYPEDGLYGGSGDGWTGSPFGPRIMRGTVLDGNGIPYGHTPFGHQWLALAGISPTGVLASDAQLVDGFVAGEVYRFTVFAADADGCTNPTLEIVFDDGAGTTYFDRKRKLAIGGPYPGGPLRYEPITYTFTSPVTGALRLTLQNPVVPKPGESPALISVDEVRIVHMAADTPVDAVFEPRVTR